MRQDMSQEWFLCVCFPLLKCVLPPLLIYGKGKKINETGRRREGKDLQGEG